MKPLHVAVIIGSTRDGRFSEHAAAWVAASLQKRSDITSEVIDLKDYDMPFFSEAVSPGAKTEPYAHPAVAQFTSKIAGADAFIIVSPEYNRGYSAVLKNAIDWVYQEWNKKTVAFVSYGSVGGARAVEQLRLVSVELQMAPIRQGVHIMAPWMLRTETGALKEGALDQYERALNDTIENLVFWGTALKTARES